MGTTSELTQVLDRIIKDGVVTQDEYDRFIELVHLDGKISEEERAELSRLFRLVQSGEIEIINEDRNKTRQKH